MVKEIIIAHLRWNGISVDITCGLKYIIVKILSLFRIFNFYNI